MVARIGAWTVDGVQLDKDVRKRLHQKVPKLRKMNFSTSIGPHVPENSIM